MFSLAEAPAVGGARLHDVMSIDRANHRGEGLQSRKLPLMICLSVMISCGHAGQLFLQVRITFFATHPYEEGPA